MINDKSIDIEVRNSEIGVKSIDIEVLNSEIGAKSIEVEVLNSEIGAKSIDIEVRNSEIGAKSIEFDVRNRMFYSFRVLSSSLSGTCLVRSQNVSNSKIHNTNKKQIINT